MAVSVTVRGLFFSGWGREWWGEALILLLGVSQGFGET